MKATGIEWTDTTWNPVRGCSRVSKGCEHCYAEQVARRFAGPGQPYEGLVVLDAEGTPRAKWNGVVRPVTEHLADPLHWTKPRRVFVNSMSDLFHESLSFEDIAAVFGVMAAAQKHTFQVLTKRPARAREFFEQAPSLIEMTGLADEAISNAIGMSSQMAGRLHGHFDEEMGDTEVPWPLPNVWIGVSVENQATADERIPVLLGLPAAVRWVSYEPALGGVDFTRLEDDELGTAYNALSGRWSGNADLGRRLDWIVIGGESGPGARPFDLAWARATIAQCREAGTAVFVKQLGARQVATGEADRGHLWPTGEAPRLLDVPLQHLSHRKGGDMSEWPEDLRVREWPQ